MQVTFTTYYLLTRAWSLSHFPALSHSRKAMSFILNGGKWLRKKRTPWFRRRRKVTLCVIGWPPFASCGVPSMTGIDPQTLYVTDSMAADLECDTIHPYSQYRYNQWHIDSYAWDNESHCPMSNSKNFIVTKACLHYSLSLLWQYSQKFLHECRLEIRMKSKPATDITGAWLHADLDSVA